MKNKIVLISAIAVLIVICAAVAFRCSDFFEDQLYNRGLILHSAAASRGPALQTSLVTEYYSQYPIERAEDWHRSLSVLLASVAVRLTGAPVMIDILHCLYLGIFGSLLFLIIRRAALDGPYVPGIKRLRQADWIALGTIAAIALSPYGLLVLSRTALDDIPAGCLVLAGLTLMLDKEFPSAVAAVGAGALFGTAFWAKDLYLLWTGIGSLILLVGLLSNKPRLTFSRLVIAGLPTLAAAPIAAAKLLWNHADLGTFLSSLALTENRIFIYGRFSGVDPHFPYYLTGENRLGSAIALAGGVVPAVKAAVLVQLPALHVLSDNFIPILPLLLAALFVPRQFNAERAFFARVGRAVSVTLVVYIVFFLTGASTVDQPRYWIVPAGLACGLGLIFAVDLWQKQQFSLPKLRLAIAGVFYAVAIFEIPSAYFALRKAPLIPPGMVAWVHETLEGGDPRDTVALNGRRAFYYYGVTGDRVVTIWPEALHALSMADGHRWLTDYHVHLAVVQDSDQATRSALEKLGFSAVHEDGGYTALAASPEGPKG